MYTIKKGWKVVYDWGVLSKKTGCGVEVRSDCDYNYGIPLTKPQLTLPL